MTNTIKKDIDTSVHINEPALFSPLTLRSRTVRNRAWMAPMCQYWANAHGPHQGAPHDWHFVHLGTRAVGGTGLILTEATSVTPEGRLTTGDLGLWNSNQTRAFSRIAQFAREQGAEFGIQIAHAGRKASILPPWEGRGSLSPASGGWPTLAPSESHFPGYEKPAAMTHADIQAVVRAFRDAARRAREADCTFLEVHGGHGYLLHQFLSPISNQRTDEYGGSETKRMRFSRDVVRAVREEWPDELPLLFRISATDWMDDSQIGYRTADAVALSAQLKEDGVDLMDVSSGGLTPAAIPLAPSYQVPFAQQIRDEAEVLVSAVGLITTAAQADEIIRQHQSDAVFLGRELLRSPYWPREASRELSANLNWEPPYERARL